MKDPKSAKQPISTRKLEKSLPSKNPLVSAHTTAKREEATLKRGLKALEHNPTDDDVRATLI